MGVGAVAGAALALTAVSAYQQYEAAGDAKKAASRQADEQRQQYLEEKRIADMKNLREAREAVRRARVANASIINAGANTGTSGSSGVIGGSGSVRSQLGSNLAYFGAVGAGQSRIADSQVRETYAIAAGASAQAKSAQWGAIGSLGGTIFDAAGGYTTLFGGNKK
jgi:hypothetical protein